MYRFPRRTTAKNKTAVFSLPILLIRLYNCPALICFDVFLSPAAFVLADDAPIPISSASEVATQSPISADARPSNSVSGLSPRTIALAVLCNLLWAGAYVTGKQMIGTPTEAGFGPFRSAFLRFAVAGFLMFLWMRIWKPKSLLIARADVFPMLGVGVLGITLTYLFNYAGLAFSSATAAALILATEPVWIALLAIAFLRERATLPRIGGIVLGVAGATLVVLSTQKPDTAGNALVSGATWGNLLMVASLLFESIAVLIIKRLVARYSGQTIVVYQFLFGAILLLPFALWEGQTSGWVLPHWKAWLAFAYLVTACTLIAYTLWFVLLETTDASDLSIYLFLQPVVGAVLGVLYLNDSVTALTGVGAFLVLAGVFCTVRADAAARGRRKTAETEVTTTRSQISS